MSRSEDFEDKEVITAYEQTVRDLLRSLVALYSGEVQRYEALRRRAEQRRDAVIRAAYAWHIEPKELKELSGIGNAKLHGDVLNTNAYPDLRRQRQATPGDRAATARFNNVRRTMERLAEEEEDESTNPDSPHTR